MKVPLLDLKAQYEPIKNEINKAIFDVVENQNFILGETVKRFETKIANFIGTKHAIGVSSGSDALLISLMALDLKQSDEIITTPYSFFATAGAISRLGAKPVFAEIDEKTFNLDANEIENKITSKTKAILPVHLFGQIAEMDKILEIAEKYNLKIIEDAAQAIGSEFKNGKQAGTFGTFGCFSFYPSKNLGCFGDAGLVTTNDDELAEKIKILRSHGSKPKYYNKFIGGNFRIDAIQSAVLDVKLNYLENWTKKRQENAKTYDELFKATKLTEKITLPYTCKGNKHIFNQYVICLEERDKLMEFLKLNGIGSEIYYPVTFNNQECFAYLGYKQGDFPKSEKCAKTSLAIPVYPELTLEMQEMVVGKIKEFFSRW
ncbi:DegT/DnrJ/EryC1/StrS family aminotransferase [bacterium]|nr:DegT/DnrJ/EryC1/StrS family aminotransferase [bacterium]